MSSGRGHPRASVLLAANHVALAGVVVIAIAVPLIRIAAFFQLFDGIQTVAGGALRFGQCDVEHQQGEWKPASHFACIGHGAVVTVISEDHYPEWWRASLCGQGLKA